MRPQPDEPCVNCAHWNDKKGCKMGRYHSTSMVIFGYCGFCKQKQIKKEEGA